MLIVPRRYVGFTALVALRQHSIDRSEMIASIGVARRRTRLELHFRLLREFDRFQRAKHTMLKDRVYRFHGLSLLFSTTYCQFHSNRNKPSVVRTADWRIPGLFFVAIVR